LTPMIYGLGAMDRSARIRFPLYPLPAPVISARISRLFILIQLAAGSWPANIGWLSPAVQERKPAGLVGPGTKCIENRLKFSAIPRTVWRGADEMGQPARVRPDPRGYLWRPSAGEIATGKARSTLEVDCRDAFDPTSLLETCGTLCS